MGSWLCRRSRSTVVPNEMYIDPDGFIIWDDVTPLIPENDPEDDPENDPYYVELPIPSGFFRRALSDFKEGSRYKLTLSKIFPERPSIYRLESIKQSYLHLLNETNKKNYYIEYELLFGPDVTFDAVECCE